MGRMSVGWWMVLAVAVVTAGCAKNVGHQVGAVRDDQRQFAAALALEPVDPASVFAKSSSVSSSATYAGVHAQKVQDFGLDALRQLGYVTVIRQPAADNAFLVVCHRLEPGRSATFTRGPGAMEVIFRVSGWSHDREVCPGAADRS